MGEVAKALKTSKKMVSINLSALWRYFTPVKSIVMALHALLTAPTFYAKPFAVRTRGFPRHGTKFRPTLTIHYFPVS